jgi:hypothetical protein
LDDIGLVVYEMSFKVKVYRRQAKSDHKSSPCHFVTGDLKTGSQQIHHKNLAEQNDFHQGKRSRAVYITAGYSQCLTVM